MESTLYTERIKDVFAPPVEIQPTEIDDVDRTILDTLARNGRASYVEIARETHFSPSAIRARVHRLIDRGVVNVRALVTPGKVGLQHMCGVGLRLRAREEGPTVAAIALMDAVSYLSLTLGRFDAIATLLVKTSAELTEALDVLRSLPGVESLESWTHLDVLKVDHSLS